ncbi:MAG: helix-turn-helix domain-containing protein [Woeseiaceae bacterium]|nr:helix-turn-helix domain-containing protein [Woeseiaceae bacterium]
MDERLRFIARLLEGEKMAPLRREFGISRVTGYQIFNRYNERPHQALDGAYPGDLYTPSARVYEPPRPPDYPFHDRAIRVTGCGRICIGRRKINLSTAFAGQTVGVTEVEDQIWLVSFMDYDLGYFDNERGRAGTRPESVHAGQSVNHVSGKQRRKPCVPVNTLITRRARRDSEPL